MTYFALTLGLLLAAEPDGDPRPFVIQVVDDQTGRGVPLVELRTVNQIRLITDSAGIVAFKEPGLMDRSVFFTLSSHGYEFPKDGFGFRGKALDTKPGARATLRIKRLNIAERLYRITGGGIYRDSVLAGLPTPIKQPLLNADVFGQDSVLNAIFMGKLYWFWGDTNRPSYPLGNFHSPGATSPLPDQGGIDPNLGVDLAYLLDEKGFARPTCKMPGEGPTWIQGLTVLKDAAGKERMFAGYMKVKGFLDVYERGLVEFNPEKQEFEKIATFPLNSPAFPHGHPFLRKDKDAEYVYFADPFPLTRVLASPDALKDPAKYQTFSPLVPGSEISYWDIAYFLSESILWMARVPPRKVIRASLEREPSGALVYGWKANTPAVGPKQQNELMQTRKLRSDEALLPLQEFDTARAVAAHAGSIAWNPFRKRWVAIFHQSGGSSSNLGEVWFAEADTMLGPWVYARKIVTHDRYSFYNVKQHPEFIQDGGKTVFFEGTYTALFSRSDDLTPFYDYNQIMYKLNLSDPRLNLPVPYYVISAAGVPDRFGSATAGALSRTRGPAAFFALEKPNERSVPVYEVVAGGGVALKVGQRNGAQPGRAAAPLFHALPRDANGLPATALALYEFLHADGVHHAYSTDPELNLAGYTRQPSFVCYVWRNPLRLALPIE